MDFIAKLMLIRQKRFLNQLRKRFFISLSIPVSGSVRSIQKICAMVLMFSSFDLQDALPLYLIYCILFQQKYNGWFFLVFGKKNLARLFWQA